MKKKVRKDKLKYKNEIRKRQIVRINSEKEIIEDDCGVSDESFNRMQNKMLEMNGGMKHTLIRDSSLERMSDILTEYAKPMLDAIDCNNKKEYEKVIIMAMTFWNCSILEELPKNRKLVNDMLKPVMPDVESAYFAKYMLV